MGPSKIASPSKKTSNKITQTDNVNIEVHSLKMTSSILGSIEKLSGRENYSSWKFSIENYLALEDLTKCLTGEETDAKKCAKAKAAIALSVDKSIFVHIKSAKTVKETWENLQRTFEDKGVARRITLMRKIVSTKLENCESMDKYVSEIMSTTQKLTDLGFEIADEWLAVFLLCGLTDEYQPMIMALEGLGQTLSSDSIKTKLLQETSSISSSDERAFFSKSKGRWRSKNGLTCYSCSKKGHKSINCPDKSKRSAESSDTGSNNNNKDNRKALVAFSAVFLSRKFDSEDWYLDSGATRHMTMHMNWIVGKKKYGIDPIRAANDELMKVDCSGAVNFSINVKGSISQVQMSNVLCVPTLTTNLLSVSQITEKGNIVAFSSKGCTIHDAHRNLLATASLVDGLYKLDGKKEMALATIQSVGSMELWHRRLAHLNSADLKHMKNGAVKGVSFVDNGINSACVACCKGKFSRKPFPKNGSRAGQLLEVVHADLAGKMECNSIGGNKYCLVLVDDYSRRTFVYMLKHKNETFDRFCSFKSFVENQTGFKIKTFRSDNGTEFCSNQFKRFFERHGIEHQTSVPYTPQQNGLAERTIRTLTEKARCMLQDANLHKRYWAEALNTAAYIKNRTASVVLQNKSPIEIWTGEKPNISHLRVFGSRAMAFVPKERRQKFDAKAKEYLFVGYCETQKAYRLMDLETNKVIASRDVEIIEHGNNFSDTNVNKQSFQFVADINESCESASEDDINETIVDRSQHNEQRSNDETNGVQHGQNNVDQQESRLGVQHGRNNADDTIAETDLDYTQVDEDSVYEPSTAGESTMNESAYQDAEDHNSTQNRRPERERRAPSYFGNRVAFANAEESYLSVDGISTHFANQAVNDEPITVNEALSGNEKRQWTAAMNEEYQSLIDNRTWDLVDLPDGCRAINCKWVFKCKTDSNGNVARFKARVVAKGYSQREGIDYVQTFSPVVRYPSIRLLMSIAVKFGWSIEQMDVVTAFLHGDIEETIYMKQPEEYDDGSGRVCRLRKALYGLKQASRQWNVKLNGVLEQAGYRRCKTDPCVYVRSNEKSIVVIAVYVDDMLIFSNNSTWKDELKNILKGHFNMKDLGKATSVLGMRIDYNQSKGMISLDQQKYTELVLRRFNMFECDPVKIPSDPNQKLTKDMSPSCDSEVEQMKLVPYQEAIGSIMYLAQCTRPDISFSVSNLSQFNKCPGMAHWKAVKRVLRYLKGTLNCKLKYDRNSKITKLCGYTDADWGSSFIDSKSCTGYVFICQGGAVTWATKKQPTVALSTGEAEYMSVSAATQEALWLAQLKTEILDDEMSPLEIHCDNKAAVDLTEKGTFSPRAKHIAIRHHFIRDHVKKNNVKIVKITTDEMIADNLTKAVPIQKHQFCFREMGLTL